MASNKRPRQYKPVANVEDSSSEDEYLFGIHKASSNKQPRVDVQICGSRINALIDTGASVDVMSQRTFDTLKITPPLTKPIHTRVYAYNSDKPLQITGTFEALVTHKENISSATFFVVAGNCDTLLSFNTALALKIVHISYAVQHDGDILSKYADRFEGIGKLKDTKCKLHIDETVRLVTQPHRRIPFHVRKQTEKELQRLLDPDIIERVGDEPTPWVSSSQVVPKPKSPDQIRICVDMRAANKAVQRKRHITPTIDDIISKVNGAKVFSKLDLNAGYHQIELAEESRYITVFSTYIGLFRYKRLNFGVTSAAEVFQNLIQSSLHGLDGVINISDDILIFARSQDEMNTRLDACLQRLRDRNLTLNKAKCEFNRDSIAFFGHIFSAEGISPDPQKVKAILNASDPQTVSEVRSLLGLATYCSRFIPDLATISAPLCDLTRESTNWKWTKKHHNAIREIKQRLATSCSTSYYDPDKATQLIVDASPVGLGAILAQTDKDGNQSIVGLASRSLTPVEQRYSQIESEALSVTWGTLHYHLYLYGNNFEVVTDHKPLVTLFNNPNSKPPMRIERWILKLQEYRFQVAYQPGKLNPADYLSRHPLPTTKPASHKEKMAEQHVSFVTSNAVPKTLTLSELKSATETDHALQLCIEALRTNNWKAFMKQAVDPDTKSTLQSMYKIRDELTVILTNDLILRRNCIVIPASAQDHVIELAHEGHQGIVKTKQLLREKVWFPGIDRLVERKISQCIPCQATSSSTLREPLQMSTLPAGPWLEVSVDFADLPSGKHLLVVTDDYSRYPVVEIVTSTSVKAVIPKLDAIFSQFGIPQIIRSDNGPPFNSGDFKKFAAYLGFKHRRITPLWPRANAERHKPITRGDPVLVKRDGFIRKQQTPYDTNPYRVVDVKGPMITAEREGHRVTQNSSFFKTLPHSIATDSESFEPTDIVQETAPDEPTKNNGTSESPETQTNTEQRYPTRTRKSPEYLKDYVPS
ncbi:uncharacterized protein K02A2.6-like [Patiria miniata]|uniref:RNA-directed DNA polymerase n=1 Tax=Patiria miniata TaxID=46514 RepID=A0A913ZD05_PATMI|nr:uncharacterized protein K02A2.6-like [Patiria miniata]